MKGVFESAFQTGETFGQFCRQFWLRQLFTFLHGTAIHYTGSFFFWRIIYQTKITHTLVDTYIEITAAIASPPCFSSCCYILNRGLV